MPQSRYNGLAARTIAEAEATYARLQPEADKLKELKDAIGSLEAWLDRAINGEQGAFGEASYWVSEVERLEREGAELTAAEAAFLARAKALLAYFELSLTP